MLLWTLKYLAHTQQGSEFKPPTNLTTGKVMLHISKLGNWRLYFFHLFRFSLNPNYRVMAALPKIDNVD